MKRYILKFIMVLTITLTACKKQEPVNVRVPYEDTVILVGPATIDGFSEEPFNEWYDENYKAYQINESLLPSIRKNLENTSITVFMGTWCGDSQREIPNFIKILKAADFDFDNFNIITVDSDKKTPQNLERGLNITNVPTLIFYKNGKELNRIVEFPLESLEEDMLKILKDQPYEHAYFNVELQNDSE